MDTLDINSKDASDRTQWRQAIKEQGETKFRGRDFEEVAEDFLFKTWKQTERRRCTYGKKKKPNEYLHDV